MDTEMQWFDIKDSFWIQRHQQYQEQSRISYKQICCFCGNRFVDNQASHQVAASDLWLSNAPW